MKITENSVSLCRTAKQAIYEEEALQRGMAEKSKEFMESGAEIYAEA
jgi:phosphomethylpyrimidine synthase